MNHQLNLPDMDVVFSTQDEPRVVFNIHTPNAHTLAMQDNDPNALSNYVIPTSSFFGLDGDKKCLLPISKTGFGDLVNDMNGCECFVTAEYLQELTRI